MRKNSKINVNLILYSSIVAIIVLITIILFVINLLVSKPVIAFYKVPQNVQAQLKKSVQKSSGKEYRSIILDESLPLPAQQKSLKHSTILFAYNDCSVSDFIETSNQAKPIPASYLNGMPSTISNSVKKFSNNIKTVPVLLNKIKTVPVLFDFYQIDVNFPLYQKTEVPNIDYWTDFLRVAMIEKSSSQAPIIFAGGDDSTLLNVVGMITEALCGNEVYNQTLKSLYEAFKKDFDSEARDSRFGEIDKELEKACSEGGTLFSAINELNSLFQNKLLTKEVLSMQKDTANFYADNNLTGILFLTLSQHRNISREVINDFRTIYCPAYPDNFERKFVAPEYCAICLKGNKKTEKIIVDISSTMQTEISTVTGLSPVQKSCAVADSQADDVRYWLAASSGPLKPLDAAFPTPASRAYAANYIRNLILLTL